MTITCAKMLLPISILKPTDSKIALLKKIKNKKATPTQEQ